jgi:hypothetical protein
MAQFDPSSMNGLLPWRTHLGSTPIVGYAESTSATFKYGQLVELDQTDTGTVGQVIEASSLSTGYLGVAAAAASSVQGTVQPVYVSYPDNMFLGWVKEPILSTMVGQDRSFRRDSTLAIDYLGVNSSAADNRAVIMEIEVEGPDGRWARGDTGGYVAFQFIKNFTQFGHST